MPPLFHVQNSAIRWFNAPERFGGGKKPGRYEEEAVDVDAGVNEQRLLEQDAAIRAADAAELQRDQRRQDRRKRTRSDLFLSANPYPDAEAEADEASWHQAAIRKLNRGRFRAAHPPTDSDRYIMRRRRYIMRRRRWGQRAAAEDLPAGASSETEEDESNAADNARAALNRLPGKRRRFRDKEAADVADEDLAHEGAYLNPDERAELADIEAEEKAGKAEDAKLLQEKIAGNEAYMRENFGDYKGSGRPAPKLTPDQRAKVKRLVVKLIPPKERGWTLERVARKCPFTTKQNIIHYKLAYMICAGLRDPKPTSGFNTIESAQTRWHGGTRRGGVFLDELNPLSANDMDLYPTNPFPNPLPFGRVRVRPMPTGAFETFPASFTEINSPVERIRRLIGPDVKKWRARRQARKQAAKEVWRNLTFIR